MPEFVSKPVQIEARQWEGGPDTADRIIVWILANGGQAKWHDAIHTVNAAGKVLIAKPETLCIDTLEGTMAAKPGDWIIRGTENEFYPCIDSVFRRKYEPTANRVDLMDELYELLVKYSKTPQGVSLLHVEIEDGNYEFDSKIDEPGRVDYFNNARIKYGEGKEPPVSDEEIHMCRLYDKLTHEERKQVGTRFFHYMYPPKAK